MVRVLVVILLVLLPRFHGASIYIGRLTGLYMGWVGHANMGDELVLDIFGHLLRDSLLQLATYQRVSLEYQHPLTTGTRARLNYSTYNFAVLGGGSLLETSYTSRTDMCQGVREAHIPLYVHGTGTQLPFTGYDGRNFRCVEKPIWGGVRGPLTNELLASMAKHFNSNDTRQLPIFGDSGILADRIFPRVSWGLVDSLDQVMAASSEPVLCVSGAVQAGHKGTPEFKDTPELIKAWIQKYTVVLLPVDPLTAKHQEAMIASIRDTSSADRRDHLFLNAHINHYGVWLSILGRCDLVLTVRLHAAVMAVAAGTPFIMPYSDGISRKAKDFVLGTYGADRWEDFFMEQAKFDGSVATVAQLLRDVRVRGPRQKAAFDRAITTAYSSYMSSLKEFVGVILPESYRSFTDVCIRIKRYYNSAIFALVFQ